MIRAAALALLLVPAQEQPALDHLERRAREVAAAVEHRLDLKDVPRLQQQLRASLGIDRLPKSQAQNVRSVGTLEREGYRIEKIVFDTFSEVPAHLYLPSKQGIHPALLFVPGHWWADSKSRPDFQAFCINMARRGFVVLTYDPIGQGERGISFRDHRRTEALLVGVSQMGLALFEAQCALKVLLSRPDVDAARVGVTGASGGGYTSWILAALDPRIAVSVPVVGTSEFVEQLSVCRPLDWYNAREHCHFVPGLLRYANNHEFLAMIAPRPVMVISAHNDQSFPIPGLRQVVDYGRKLYAALGEPSRIGAFEDDMEGHGYQKRKREAAYGWFAKWLKGEGDGSPVSESATETLPWDAPELRCFPPGENRPAGPGIIAQVDTIARQITTSGGMPKSVVRRFMVEALGSSDPHGPVALERRGDRLSWRSDGLEIPAVLMAPPGPWKGAMIAASDSGRESLRDHAAVRAAVEAGIAVVAADPRGLGEKPGWVFATSLLLGENYIGRQAEDLVAGWRALRALPELEGKPIGLLGSGPFASMASLYAALLEPRASWLVAEGGFASYRSFIDRERSLKESYTLAKPGEERTVRIDREIPSALVVFDALRRFDLPDFYGAILPRPVLLVDPIDGNFEKLTADALQALLAKGRYRWKDKPEMAGDAAAFLRRVCVPLPERKPIGANPSKLVERGLMPNRVHVFEDYETGIERRWWHCGKLEAGASRATPALDFDGQMGDPARSYAAVVFNPVPGPPMGKNPRLAFRYRIQGGDTMRIQIYTLTKGYHRHLTVSGLAQGAWTAGAVDMTDARRPDGSGGPLSEDERIDDIQFYVDPEVELLIDDIVLYDAAADGEREPFPRRIIFTGGFDTGRQGQEWPGDFETVPHGKWKAAKSVVDPKTGRPWLRVHLRGERPLGAATKARFDYKLVGADRMRIDLGNRTVEAKGLKTGEWTRVTVDVPGTPTVADEIRFLLPAGGELLLDDLLLYEP